MKFLSQRSLIDSPDAAAIVPEIAHRWMYHDAIDRSAAVLRQIAPQDLAGRAVYIVPFIREEADGPCKTCMGYTDFDLDLQLQPFLEAHGQWRGRGFATLFDLASFEDGLAVSPVSIVSDMRRFAIHEFGHQGEVLHESPTLVERPRGELPRHFQSRQPDYPKQTRQTPEHPEYSPFYLHGLNWVRAVLHLMYRTDQAGLGDLNTISVNSQLCGHSSLEDCWGYVEALGSELRECLDRPLREVLAQPWPEPFVLLGAADVGKWTAKRQEKRSQSYVPSGCARDRRRARRQLARVA